MPSREKITSAKAGQVQAQYCDQDCGDVPFACNVADMTKEERARWKELTARFQAIQQETVETDGGYRFRFASGSDNLITVAEWIAYERICCPFFEFDLRLKASDPFFWLEISGPDGAKAIVRSEILI